VLDFASSLCSRHGTISRQTERARKISLGSADDLLDIDVSGAIYNKQQIIEQFTKMKMTDYTLSDFKTFMLDKDCVVLTYISNSTATMEGKTMTGKNINSTTYCLHGGKWVPKFHTETMVPPMQQ
jgi:hypothetical protein